LITLTATPTPESTTLSLHDALPICRRFCICHSLRRHVAAGETENRELDCAERFQPGGHPAPVPQKTGAYGPAHHLPVYCSGNGIDRKSTRLNSSHVKISYAVFCLKK